jgi:predicted SAM-dependent methyltransferase
MTQLHLGCGKRFIPGFVHIDLADYPHIDFKSSISALPMFADNSVDLIYCCHAFEYFDRIEGLAVLKEWHRVLKRGGILRLAVPDFEAMAEIYLKHKVLASIHGPLFGRIVIQGTHGETKLYHRTVYDFSALQGMLAEASFSSVRRYDWRETIHKDHDDFSQAYIPHMDKQQGTLISLNVEAEK